MRRRPIGRPTRGKTAANRLRQVDVYVALALPETLAGEAPVVVDLGFGAAPWTTLEMAERWRGIEPSLRVVGLEIDADRVEAAAPFAQPPAVEFRLGGFDVAAALGGRRSRLVRCYNVLRQYDEAEAAAAVALIAEGLEPGGVLVEGTCDPSGGMAAFDVWRLGADGALDHEALVFADNFRAARAPADFRAILPKRLIHHALDPEPARFFADWERAAAIVRGRGLRSRRHAWAETAAVLREHHGWPVDPRPRLLERGYLTLGTDLG